MKGAREAGEEICLDYYSTNGTWSHDKKFNDGEYALYDLPDLNTYDGIVFDCTNTISKEQIDHIVSKLKNLKVPVVSIGYDMEGFYYVGNHNKNKKVPFWETFYFICYVFIIHHFQLQL